MTLPTISQKLLLFLEKDTLANFLLEREQTLVNTLLLRYRNIAEMAPLPDDDDIKEVTAAQTFQLKVETAALVNYLSYIILIHLMLISSKIRAAEDLMSLTRELKELWLFGPLRGLNEGEAEANAKIEEDSKEVAKLVDSLVKKEGGDEKA